MYEKLTYGLPAATTTTLPCSGIGDYLRTFRVFMKLANGICYKRQRTFSSQHPQVQYVEGARNKCGTAYFVKNIKYYLLQVSYICVRFLFHFFACLLRKLLCSTTNIIILYVPVRGCVYVCVGVWVFYILFEQNTERVVCVV